MRLRAYFVLGAIAIAIVAAGACRTRRPTIVEQPPDEPDRFPHESHQSRGLGCADCHGASGDDRPGASDHAPCDRGKCHAAEFQAAPGPLCRVCHVDVDVTGGGPNLRPYPLEGGVRALPAKFAHRTHLDPATMERAVGFHVACLDCHPARDDSEAPAAPDHVACSRCHAAEVALPRAPQMTDCAGCHTAGERTARHPRKLITGDLHFDHRNHRTDASGKSIPCRGCHEGAITATGRQDHPPPSVRDCVTCHDDADRVPPSMQMRICETCHVGRSVTLGSLAPRDHLPLTERPLDHTIAFRTDHGEAARQNAARCATCHTQLSGSTVDTCDECHQVMRPQDHVVTWRELDHGGFALNDSDRCATCHTVDYCSDCHSIRPRSHMGGRNFDLLEHGDLARVNIRSCMTCHEPQRDCTRSGCHSLMPAVPP